VTTIRRDADVSRVDRADVLAIDEGEASAGGIDCERACAIRVAAVDAEEEAAVRRQREKRGIGDTTQDLDGFEVAAGVVHGEDGDALASAAAVRLRVATDIDEHGLADPA
jgi:hypothetical protein